MHVDLLCEFGSLNGGEQSILALIPLLKRWGVTFRTIAPGNGALVDAAKKLEVESVCFTFEPGEPLAQRRCRLDELLKSLAPKFVHVNSLNMGRIAAPVLQKQRVPHIVHLRDIIRLNKTAIADLNVADQFLAVSEATKKFHLEQGLDAAKCHVLYNGIDLERFRPRLPTGHLHRELDLPPGTKLLAVIGQIGLRKGQDALLEILAPIFAARDDIHLLIVGQRWSSKQESVQFEHHLSQRTRQEPFYRSEKSRVHFLGTRRDIPELLNELTLLVHPARQEPLGRVLLEAAACGVAVVATDVGGTREIFPDTSAAFVVPVDAPHEFRRAVERVLDDDELRKSLGYAARRQAEMAFSRELAAENLLWHYETANASPKKV